MATRVDLTVQRINYNTGLVISTVNSDATNNHEFINTNSDVNIYCDNTSTGVVTITVLTPTTVSTANLTIEDRDYTIAAGDTVLIGPWPSSWFNQSDGKVYFNIDVAGVPLAAIRNGAP